MRGESRDPAPRDPRAADPRAADPRAPDPLPHDQRRARRPAGAAKLRRSASDRRVAGIAGGIAAFTDADPRWVRAAFVLSLPVSLGVTGVGYLVLWWILPPDTGA